MLCPRPYIGVCTLPPVSTPSLYCSSWFPLSTLRLCGKSCQCERSLGYYLVELSLLRRNTLAQIWIALFCNCPLIDWLYWSTRPLAKLCLVIMLSTQNCTNAIPPRPTFSKLCRKNVDAIAYANS